MIFDVHAEISYYRELDVECDGCGSSFTIPRPDNSACEQLIDGYYFNRAVQELKLLLRIQTLFDSRPQSNHPYVIKKQYREPVVKPEDNSLLQHELDSEQDIKKFLSQCLFSYHPRRKSIEKSVKELRERLSQNWFACSECHGILRLTEECHDACGSVFFSEEARLKWIARHDK